MTQEGLAAGPAKARAAKSAHVPVPAAKATLVITRSTEMLYLGLAAAIEVNGEQVAKLERGETYTADVAPGEIELRVSGWSSPGASTFSLKAMPGKTYQFTVTPRGGNFVASMAGGLLGAAVEGHGPFEFVEAP